MIRSRRTKPRPGRLEGVELEALRIGCWSRDRGVCKECGIDTLFGAPQEWEDAFHMAHIQGKSRGGDNLNNVRTLCGNCHRKEHCFGKSMEKPVPRKVK